MAVHERAWERQQPLREWKPRGTYGILAAMGGVYILQWLSYASSAELHQYLWVVNTDWPWRPWSIVTATFSHSLGQLSHILFNGLMLYFLGPNVERLVGTKKFVILFIVAGAISAILQPHLSLAYLAALDLVPITPSEALLPMAQPLGPGALGASGAIMMVLGMLVILMPKAKIMLLFPPIPMPMWVLGVGYAALDILGAFNPFNSVGNFAHLSGMAVGLFYGWQHKKRLEERGLRIQY